MVNPEDIHLNLTIFEKDLNKIAIGQKVMAYTNSKPDKQYQTEIILISHNLGDDRSAEVHCHFENYDKILVPGMYMNAEVKLKNKIQQTLPEDAIVSFENKEFIFVQTKGTAFKLTPVETGAIEEGKIAISTPLKGKKIVTKGAYSLLMKLKNTAEEE